MRHFKIDYIDMSGNDATEILSESDIKAQYWPYWYGKMCDKFGKDDVDLRYTFADCLDDFIVVNWAVEVTDEIS